MAEKKKYYIPTIEIVSVQTKLMSFPLGGSPDKGQAGAPRPRRDPAF